MAIKIDQQKCNGCGACMDGCNVGAIYLVDKKVYVDQSLCTLCGKCIEVCPVQAIQSIESVFVQQLPPAEIQQGRTSDLPAIKTAIVTVGSSLLPLLISKIGDKLSAKLEGMAERTFLTRRKLRTSGRQNRRRFRGGA